MTKNLFVSDLEPFVSSQSTATVGRLATMFGGEASDQKHISIQIDINFLNSSIHACIDVVSQHIKKDIHTHTQTHTHIYIYIYIDVWLKLPWSGLELHLRVGYIPRYLHGCVHTQLQSYIGTYRHKYVIYTVHALHTFHTCRLIQYSTSSTRTRLGGSCLKDIL